MFLLAVALVSSLCICQINGQGGRTPLDDYVDKPDSHYSYFELEDYRVENEDHTIYVLNMTSQKWLDETIVTHSIWWHYLVVCVPKELAVTDSALIFLGGGNNPSSPPTPSGDFLVEYTGRFSADVKTVAVYMKNIPNQPITFLNDPSNRRRYEDALIAWTWRMFIDDPSDPEVILRLPMTKAVVRALDTVTEFVQTLQPEVDIQKYMVAGPSKRGWTTWTVAAVDKRIVAQAPMVLSCLQFVPSLHKHWQSLGGWSFALRDYYRENLTIELDNPNTQKIMDIVDPYSYIDRYTMPTMVISAAGDQFFLPDDSHLFFDDLPGDKYMMLLANHEHSLWPYAQSYLSLRNFWLSIIHNTSRPVVSWERTTDDTSGTIIFQADKAPVNITAWYALTSDDQRRDFRLMAGNPPDANVVPWIEDNVEDLGGNRFQVTYDNPDDGWLGFFIEAEFEGYDEEPFTLTSEVHIIPDTYPFEDCQNEECYGTLV